MCMCECFACMYLCIMYVPGTWRGHKRVSDFAGAGITDSCGLPFEQWKLNLGLLQEYQVILATGRHKLLFYFMLFLFCF